MHGKIRREAVQPLPPGVSAPRSRTDNTRCCHDCALADLLVGLGYVPAWDMARTVVGNDRQEQLRLPGAPLGLVGYGLMRPNTDGDLERHQAWLQQLFPARNSQGDPA
jgi:hypothetical protein